MNEKNRLDGLTPEETDALLRAERESLAGRFRALSKAIREMRRQIFKPIDALLKRLSRK